MVRYGWLFACLGTLGCVAGVVSQSLAQPAAPVYEVWAVDQNTNTLYVLDPEGKILRTIDGATLGDAKRPHMLWGVPKDEYVYSANTVSNSITVLSRKDGAVKAVIAGVGKSPHAAQPHPVRQNYWGAEGEGRGEEPGAGVLWYSGGTCGYR